LASVELPPVAEAAGGAAEVLPAHSRRTPMAAASRQRAGKPALLVEAEPGEAGTK